MVAFELLGGLEVCVADGQKNLSFALGESGNDDKNGSTLRECLVRLLKEKILPSKRNHLLENDQASVESTMELNLKPGVLLLVNQIDWELLGDTQEERLAHPIQDSDTITLITTLHGG